MTGMTDNDKALARIFVRLLAGRNFDRQLTGFHSFKTNKQ
jgi:hypothetical protein